MSEELDQLEQEYRETAGNRDRLLALDAHLEDFLSRHPDQPTALMLRAQSKLELGESGASMALAQRCSEVDPTVAMCWLTLGVLSENQRDFERAGEGYRKYRELAPEGQYIAEVDRALERIAEKTGGAPIPNADQKAEIKAEIGRRVPSLRACYEKALRRAPDLTGKLTITVTVETTGGVSGIAFEEQVGLNETVFTCVRETLKEWTLPALEEQAEYTFSVVFSGDSESH